MNRNGIQEIADKIEALTQEVRASTTRITQGFSPCRARFWEIAGTATVCIVILLLFFFS